MSDRLTRPVSERQPPHIYKIESGVSDRLTRSPNAPPSLPNALSVPLFRPGTMNGAEMAAGLDGVSPGIQMTLAEQMFALTAKMTAIYEAQLSQNLHKERKPRFEEPKFPLPSIEAFDELEERLQDSKFRRFVVSKSHLCCII